MYNPVNRSDPTLFTGSLQQPLLKSTCDLQLRSRGDSSSLSYTKRSESAPYCHTSCYTLASCDDNTWQWDRYPNQSNKQETATSKQGARRESLNARQNNRGSAFEEYVESFLARSALVRAQSLEILSKHSAGLTDHTLQESPKRPISAFRSFRGSRLGIEATTLTMCD